MYGRLPNIWFHVPLGRARKIPGPAAISGRSGNLALGAVTTTSGTRIIASANMPLIMSASPPAPTATGHAGTLSFR